MGHALRRHLAGVRASPFNHHTQPAHYEPIITMPNPRESLFQSQVRWTGSYVSGQTGARSYTREMLVEPTGKPPILGSAGTRFFGDDARYNPEDLMLASLAECHLLTYLALATKAGIRFEALSIQVTGVLGTSFGKTRFVSATLTPSATLAAGADSTLAQALHRDAHEQCFMSNSINFPIEIILQGPHEAPPG